MIDSTPTVRRQANLQGAYAESTEISDANRILFISGQIPTDEDGGTPESFERQCRNSWRRVLNVLAQHGMKPHNLMKVTTFLRERGDRDENRMIRQEILGDHLPALTVVMAELFEPEWRIEIEAVAIV